MTSKRVFLFITLMLLFMVTTAASVELNQSRIDQEHYRIRYETASQMLGDKANLAAGGEFPSGLTGSAERPKLKSPSRAFFYSLVVPGLGQYYYGSKIKPLVFLSAEIASWAMYFKWHGDGDDLTEAYEAFNREHWYRERYEDFLLWVYDTTDDRAIHEPGITHHLPDDINQQYYEMTGKYDQFAWGWDDAVHNDSTLYDYGPASPPDSIHKSVPYSARRFQYEQMRDDANNRYDKASRMIFVSIANRLISAFEAYFVVKSKNNKIKRDTWGLQRIKVRTRLKSYHSYGDTPFVTFTYKF